MSLKNEYTRQLNNFYVWKKKKERKIITREKKKQKLK